MKSTSLFMKPLSIILAIIFSYAASFCASVRASAPIQDEKCDTEFDRANGLKFFFIERKLSDLSILIEKDQSANLKLRNIRLLKGKCAEFAYSFNPPHIAFEDGAVFSEGSNGGFTYSPRVKGLANMFGGDVSFEYPEIEGAEYVMSSKVSGAFGTHSIDVGLWRISDGFFIAAFTRENGNFGKPIELIRSPNFIKSVTFFPSPDSNSGTLSLLSKIEGNITLINLDWNHSAISKALRHK